MSEERCTLTYKIIRAPGCAEEESPAFQCRSLFQAIFRVEETRAMLEEQGGVILSAIAETEAHERIVLCGEGEATFEDDEKGEYVLSMFVTTQGSFASRNIIPPISCTSLIEAIRRTCETQEALRLSGGWIIAADVKKPGGEKACLLTGQHPHP